MVKNISVSSYYISLMKQNYNIYILFCVVSVPIRSINSQYLRGFLKFPQMYEVKQSLPCLSYHTVDMQSPGQTLCDVDTT